MDHFRIFQPYVSYRTFIMNHSLIIYLTSSSEERSEEVGRRRNSNAAASIAPRRGAVRRHSALTRECSARHHLFVFELSPRQNYKSDVTRLVSTCKMSGCRRSECSGDWYTLVYIRLAEIFEACCVAGRDHAAHQFRGNSRTSHCVAGCSAVCNTYSGFDHVDRS